MRVTILGSGTLVPTGTRGPAGYGVEVDGSILLLDGGTGTLRRLAEAGLDYRAIDHVFYTHVHPDHTGELIPFLFAQRHNPGLARIRDIWMTGPRGFASFYERLTAVFERWITADTYAVHVRELWDTSVDVGRTCVRALPMRHSVAAVGYRITAPDGATLAYTGDTDVTDAVVELAGDADVLIADCSTPDEGKVEGHLTPGFVGELARAARARMVVLSHLYPECEGAEIEKQCRRRYDGPVVRAHDLMRIEVRPGAPARVEPAAACALRSAAG